jgi:hypothetical protein
LEWSLSKRGSTCPTSPSRAVLWQNGVMSDLNTLVPAGSSLSLLQASAINSAGQIAGYALQTSAGNVHAFLATPTEDRSNREAASPAAQSDVSATPSVTLPESVRKLLRGATDEAVRPSQFEAEQLVQIRPIGEVLSRMALEFSTNATAMPTRIESIAAKSAKSTTSRKQSALHHNSIPTPRLAWVGDADIRWSA